MNHLTGTEKAAAVQTMFTRIARRYDLMNRLMTAGQDMRWRRQAVALARIPNRGRMLDIGTGSGDMAALVLRQAEDVCVVGGDFTLAMMQQGRQRKDREAVRWSGMDALRLPFPDACFDAVTSAYLMRNVSNINQALAEQYRVLKPGGVAVCMDTSRPKRGWLHLPMRLYLRFVIPLLGTLLTGDRDAYSYLPESTEQFLSAEELADCMCVIGFRKLRFRRFAGDTMALHWGYK